MNSFAISASVFLHCQGEILLLKRASGIEAGGWFVPGGHVEYGESPEQTVCRETLEEIGIALAPSNLRLLETITLLPADGLHHLGLIYLAPFPGGSLQLNDEHSAARWVTPAYYRDRFLDPERLTSLGLPERSLVASAQMVRVVESVIAALAQTTTGSSGS